MPRDGKLEWMAPERENIHIEVAVRDKADGRLIPGLDIDVTLIDDSGKEVGTHRQPLAVAPLSLSLRPQLDDSRRRHLFATSAFPGAAIPSP